jgi:1,2-phenylacetyl-CoA epoxidase catalytic subunit
MGKIKGRNLTSVELSDAASDAVRDLCQRTGMKKLVALSRMIDWLSRAPGPLQDVALQIHSQQMNADYAKALRSIAEHLEGGDCDAVGSIPPMKAQRRPRLQQGQASRA